MKMILFFLLLQFNVFHCEIGRVSLETLDLQEQQRRLSYAIEQLGKTRLKQITNFDTMPPIEYFSSSAIGEMYFYRFVVNDARSEGYRYLYALENDIDRKAGDWIIKLAKICEKSFSGFINNYTTMWNQNDIGNPNYRNYVYNGFIEVNLNFYKSFEEITNVRIVDCLQELTNNMTPLEENEINLPRNTLILFLSDYLTAANLTLNEEALGWRYTLEDFLQSRSENQFVQYIIASSFLIGLSNKAFKACLHNSLETFDEFQLILDNLGMLYKIIFYSRNNYVLEEDKRRFDRFTKQLLLMLKKTLKEENHVIIIEQRYNALEKKLKALEYPSRFWRLVMINSLLGIFWSMWFARKYPDFTEKIPVFRSIFGQQNIFRQVLQKIGKK